MPELQIAPKDAETDFDVVDVHIESSDLTPLWEDWRCRQRQLCGARGQSFFKIEDTGLFLMEQGKRIVVSPQPGADEKKVRLFILGTCMAVIMMQRGILPLHGSAVVIDGWAYAFVGHSGAGKSTLSAALASRGYPLLTDDVVALDLGCRGKSYRITWLPTTEVVAAQSGRLRHEGTGLCNGSRGDYEVCDTCSALFS